MREGFFRIRRCFCFSVHQNRNRLGEFPNQPESYQPILSRCPSFPSCRPPSRFSKQFTNELFTSGNAEYIKNTFIDVLNKATTAEWQNIYAAGNFPDLVNDITNTAGSLFSGGTGYRNGGGGGSGFYGGAGGASRDSLFISVGGGSGGAGGSSYINTNVLPVSSNYQSELTNTNPSSSGGAVIIKYLGKEIN